MREDCGFGVRGEYSGTFKVEQGKLTMHPEWRDRPSECALVLGADRLTVRRAREDHVLERNDAPHPPLADLPLLPRTVEKAVAALRKIVSEENQEKIRAMDELDIIGMHFGLGLYIRNAFGLWRNESELLDATPCNHPDDASGFILQAFWKSLKEDG